MLDPAYVRDHIDEVRAGFGRRGLGPEQARARLRTLDAERRRLSAECEGLKREQNASGEEIARAKREGIDTAPIQARNRERSQQIKQLGAELDAIEKQREQ